jgi:hypothetical protein
MASTVNESHPGTPPAAKAKKHEPHCCCPTCRGLSVVDRPVFGAGQILTAADLTSLQDYVRGKNRLHNRYLHGWGVVCGLEVVCDDCEGSVTIRPGYAIDPCGADILVAANTRYDVVAAIQACALQARAKTGDCDPWMPPPDPGCADVETHVCIALKYREVETAYVPGLPNARPASPGGCGCGGSCGCGGGCGGGCGCGSAAPAPAKISSGLRSSNLSCTPRRVMECFDIVVVPHLESCAPSLFKKDEKEEEGPLGALDRFIPEGTLLRNILDCVFNDGLAVFGKLSQKDVGIIAQLWSESPADLEQAGLTPADAHGAVCRLKIAIMDLLAKDSHPVRCQLRRAAAEIVLAAPNANTAPGTYLPLAKEAAQELMAVWLQLILDCICHAFLPQCGPDPCDDRVEIACVTVKGGKITDICNHSCRHYAGAFPSTFYWLSLVPVLPLIGRVLAAICCQPSLLRKNSPLVNDLAPLLDRADPTGGLRRAVTGNGFALPRVYLARARAAGAEPLIAAARKRFDTASTRIQSAGQKVKAESGAAEVARAGIAVGGDGNEEVAALRREVEALKQSVAALKAQPGRKRGGGPS